MKRQKNLCDAICQDREEDTYRAGLEPMARADFKPAQMKLIRRKNISCAKGLMAWGENLGIKGSVIARCFGIVKSLLTKVYKRGENCAKEKQLKLTLTPGIEGSGRIWPRPKAT